MGFKCTVCPGLPTILLWIHKSESIEVKRDDIKLSRKQKESNQKTFQLIFVPHVHMYVTSITNRLSSHHTFAFFVMGTNSNLAFCRQA